MIKTKYMLKHTLLLKKVMFVSASRVCRSSDFLAQYYVSHMIFLTSYVTVRFELRTFRRTDEFWQLVEDAIVDPPAALPDPETEAAAKVSQMFNKSCLQLSGSIESFKESSRGTVVMKEISRQMSQIPLPCSIPEGWARTVPRTFHSNQLASICPENSFRNDENIVF